MGTVIFSGQRSAGPTDSEVHRTAISAPLAPVAPFAPLAAMGGRGGAWQFIALPTVGNSAGRANDSLSGGSLRLVSQRLGSIQDLIHNDRVADALSVLQHREDF